MVIESLSCVEFWLILLLTRIDLCKKIDKYVLHRNWSKFWQRTLNWLITYRTIHYYILTEMSTSSTYIFKFELSLWFRIFIRISLQDWNNFDMTAIPQYLKEFFCKFSHSIYADIGAWERTQAYTTLFTCELYELFSGW